MKRHSSEFEDTEYKSHGSATGSMFTGFLVGGIIGAATALLFAPRSGEEMRAEIHDRAVDLRDRTTETLNDTVSQARDKASEVKDTLTDRAEDLKQRGKQVAREKLDRASQIIEDGKKKVEEY